MSDREKTPGDSGSLRKDADVPPLPAGNGSGRVPVTALTRACPRTSSARGLDPINLGSLAASCSPRPRESRQPVGPFQLAQVIRPDEWVKPGDGNGVGAPDVVQPRRRDQPLGIDVER
jgi:hypothetical protein